MADAFEELVADVVDEDVTPTAERVSRYSSGVSSSGTSGGAAPGQAALEAAQDLCCPICHKDYKKQKAYLKHLFVHKVQEYNPRKPDSELVSVVAQDYCIKILEEIKNEYGACKEKKDIVNHLLNTSVGTPDWLMFLQYITDPISDSLTKRTKLLPSNQYEEFLVNFNKFLNTKESFTELLNSFELLVLESQRSSGMVKLILSWLCQRLPEEIQIYIVTEMAKRQVSSSLLSQTEMNDEAFKATVSDMLHCYYLKGCRLQQNQVWRMRCQNIKSAFVSYKDETSDEDNVMTLKSNWLNGNIFPSFEFLAFCKRVEKFIKLQLTTKDVTQDDLNDLVVAILEPENVEIINCWTSLTGDYFSEVDSLVFMRDFVLIFCKHSMKLEERLRRSQQEAINKFQRVALRENLNRN